MLNDIINTIGALSSQAQGIRCPITSSSKFYSSDQKMYFKIVDNNVIGLLKIGTKSLFINDRYGAFHQITPMCVLDFYVHESQQRSGYGKQIFEKMLKVENISPRKIAYDRPSEKLINFLKKYYKLEKYVPQNNNFIVYDDYFVEETISNRKKQDEFNDNFSYKPKESKANKVDCLKNQKRNDEDDKFEETKEKIVVKQNFKAIPNDSTLSPSVNYSKKPKENQFDQFNTKFSSAQTNRNERKYDDEVDTLNIKMGNLKINQKTENVKVDNSVSNKNNLKTSPWAVDQTAKMFPTSSSQYGAHYFNKNK